MVAALRAGSRAQLSCAAIDAMSAGFVSDMKQLAVQAVLHTSLALLRADHKLVSDLFAQFQTTRSGSRKKTLVAQTCRELTVHAQTEEEIFYPAVKQALKDKELMPERQQGEVFRRCRHQGYR